MLSVQARELAELEAHHTAAGGAVAARGEALLVEQKLARSRDKMLLQKIIFSRAFRARSFGKYANTLPFLPLIGGC